MHPRPQAIPRTLSPLTFPQIAMSLPRRLFSGGITNRCCLKSSAPQKPGAMVRFYGIALSILRTKLKSFRYVPLNDAVLGVLRFANERSDCGICVLPFPKSGLPPDGGSRKRPCFIWEAQIFRRATHVGHSDATRAYLGKRSSQVFRQGFWRCVSQSVDCSALRTICMRWYPCVE